MSKTGKRLIGAALEARQRAEANDSGKPDKPAQRRSKSIRKPIRDRHSIPEGET